VWTAVDVPNAVARLLSHRSLRAVESASLNREALEATIFTVGLEATVFAVRFRYQDAEHQAVFTKERVGKLPRGKRIIGGDPAAPVIEQAPHQHA
jgi:hypothetical protein